MSELLQCSSVLEWIEQGVVRPISFKKHSKLCQIDLQQIVTLQHRYGVIGKSSLEKILGFDSFLLWCNIIITPWKNANHHRSTVLMISHCHVTLFCENNQTFLLFLKIKPQLFILSLSKLILCVLSTLTLRLLAKKDAYCVAYTQVPSQHINTEIRINHHKYIMLTVSMIQDTCWTEANIFSTTPIV